MSKRRIGPGVLLLAAAAFCTRAEDLFFGSAGARIHYIVEGKGEPVLVIHGWGTDLEWTWADSGIIKALAETHRVIAIDLRGHGRSDKPHDPQKYGMNMAADVIRLIDHLNIQRAHMVGYSMGARIASVLLADHPERFLTATIGGYGWEGAEARRALRMRARQTADSLERGQGVDAVIRAISPRDRPPTPEQIEAGNKIFLARNDPLAVAAAMRANPALRPSERKLRTNKVPELAIVGELDPARALVGKLAAIKPNLEIAVIPGADHMNAVRRPEFLGALQTFLAAHTAKSEGRF